MISYMPTKIFVCPEDKCELIYEQNKYLCIQCKREYFINNNIPDFLGTSGPTEAHQKELYEEITKKITPHLGFLRYPILLNHFHRKKWIDKLEVQPGMKILEIGTQNGVHLRYLKSRYPFLSDNNIAGVDIAMSGLQLGRVANPFHYTLASIYNLPFADKTFDIVLIPGIVEHLDNSLSALKEVSRVMKANAQYSAYFAVKDYGFCFQWITNDLLKIDSLIRSATVEIGHDFENVIQDYAVYANHFEKNGLSIIDKRRVHLILEPFIDFLFVSTMKLIKQLFKNNPPKVSNSDNENIESSEELIVVSGKQEISKKRIFFIVIIHFAMKALSLICSIERMFLGSSCGVGVLIHGRKTEGRSSHVAFRA